MLNSIPAPLQRQMRLLEARDAQDRHDGTPRLKRLRQIPAVTGQFLALLALMAPPGKVIEIGTSAGYSTLWLSLACRQRGHKLTTFELLEDKIQLARQTFRTAEVEDTVELVHGDALEFLPGFQDIAFCFLDAEKEIYSACYEAVLPNMVPGGLLVADNAINHRATLQPLIERALADDRVDALVVPIGKGELLCRRR
jgi:predicted O-methyltransferase YrrM